MKIENKKRKKIFWIIAIILGVIGIPMFVISLFIDSSVMVMPSFFLILFALIAAFQNIKKHYNFIGLLVGLAILGLFFKFMHWPGSGGLLFISLILLSILSIAVSFNYLKNKNKFLKWIGFFSNIIFPVMYLALSFRIKNWMAGNLYINFGTSLFVILIFSMVFTLPNSKYIEWTSRDKKLFYRGIVIPIVFIFILTALNFMVPDTFQNISGGSTPKTNFNMQNVYIIPHEGINK